MKKEPALTESGSVRVDDHALAAAQFEHRLADLRGRCDVSPDRPGELGVGDRLRRLAELEVHREDHETVAVLEATRAVAEAALLGSEVDDRVRLAVEGADARDRLRHLLPVGADVLDRRRAGRTGIPDRHSTPARPSATHAATKSSHGSPAATDQPRPSAHHAARAHVHDRPVEARVGDDDVRPAGQDSTGGSASRTAATIASSSDASTYPRAGPPSRQRRQISELWHVLVAGYAALGLHSRGAAVPPAPRRLRRAVADASLVRRNPRRRPDTLRTPHRRRAARPNVPRGGPQGRWRRTQPALPTSSAALPRHLRPLQGRLEPRVPPPLRVLADDDRHRLQPNLKASGLGTGHLSGAETRTFMEWATRGRARWRACAPGRRGSSRGGRRRGRACGPRRSGGRPRPARWRRCAG